MIDDELVEDDEVELEVDTPVDDVVCKVELVVVFTPLCTSKIPAATIITITTITATIAAVRPTAFLIFKRPIFGCSLLV